MKTFADRIVSFYSGLVIDGNLPGGISVLNPYREPEVISTMDRYFRKYYNDRDIRIPIMGINPGRYGGGLTGISFTDPVNLENVCRISNPLVKRPELSSTFIYKVIEQYGGVDVFFQHFFLTAICPLGFVKEGRNYNYYDDRALKEAVRSFIKATLIQQHAICGHPVDCICLGEGKNLKFISELNHELGLFKRIHPLAHPRFVMQYRRKRLEEFVSLYTDTLLNTHC
ncbi:MAG: DUF4918 family protein [Bacteroidales bacterium]|nr:DUF4918 family protein [Bacteroidales bacterium]